MQPSSVASEREFQLFISKLHPVLLEDYIIVCDVVIQPLVIIFFRGIVIIRRVRIIVEVGKKGTK